MKMGLTCGLMAISGFGPLPSSTCPSSHIVTTQRIWPFTQDRVRIHGKHILTWKTIIRRTARRVWAHVGKIKGAAVFFIGTLTSYSEWVCADRSDFTDPHAATACHDLHSLIPANSSLRCFVPSQCILMDLCNLS